jgi:hypothetical protein
MATTRDWLDLVIARNQRNIVSAREDGAEYAARYWEGSLAMAELCAARLDNEARESAAHRHAKGKRKRGAAEPSDTPPPDPASPYIDYGSF